MKNEREEKQRNIGMGSTAVAEMKRQTEGRGETSKGYDRENMSKE